MKKKMAKIVVATLVAALLTGCGSTTEITNDPVETEAELWAENIKSRKTESVSETLNIDSFDEKFLEFISENTEGNYMVSPLSFRYALGLLLAGAAGETKEELLKALDVKTEEEWHDYCLDFNGFTELYNDEAEKENTDRKGALKVANSVWKAAGINKNFEEGYRKTVEENYAAEYRSFTEENFVEKINEWADIKTEHLIPNLLPENYPTANLAVALVNALYFKDSWVNKFSDGSTREGVFYTENGTTSSKEFMSVRNAFSYYEDEKTQCVILPMNGGVSMAFVLGSTDGLADKIAKAETESVIVTIPKFELETEFSNKEFVSFLGKNGVRRAFNDAEADFSAMMDYDIYVSDIIQKTKIKLDEDGVEAAAATAVVMRTKSAPLETQPKEFTANKPFSFFIYTTCNDTTAIMFAGEIVK
ncbi:MAG: hypothetical protein K6B75_00275 [Lachnospiraceae bacterium]|nr:hypothetical protein [Lachnospiraceae bacterium]